MRDTHSSAPGRASQVRRLVTALVSASAAVLVAALVLLWSPVRAQSAPFVASEADGHVTGATSLEDDDLPAIANLDPALLAAMHEAAAAAWGDGITFEVTSGWRSREYQQWLLDDAIASYGSEEVARQFVATPDASGHVTGNAVDIGPIDAQTWLIEHGSRWGICQIYANERWHFQLAATPGGECPALRPDAAG